jgi:uncharacterized membrane protein (GlpM family)
MLEYIFAFFVGGIITVIITYFELSGFPTLSRLATMFPIFTWLSYLMIGHMGGPKTVADHSLFVLLGTLFAWVPYMLVIHFCAPRLGVNKSIALAILVFIILAIVFVKIYQKA